MTDAIGIYHRCLALAPRSERPLDWAKTHVNLGNALARLGERESGMARLEGAVAAYRDAFEENTRARVSLQIPAIPARAPLQHLTTGVSGNFAALFRLDERESGTACLEEAVAAYRDALEEYTRERVPLDWARTQNNLGLALFRLGERESGTARLEEAAFAYREALKENIRERVPLDWAKTQGSLGSVLLALGERESGTARIEEAVAAFRDVLKEWTRARAPLHWATTQEVLARAYCALYGKTAEPRHLDNALAAIAAAVDGYRKAKADFYIEQAERQRQEILALKGK